MAAGLRGGREKDGAIADGKETFTFFFGSESPFSQWHPAEFEVEGVVYNCAEQYMMHRKAGRQTCSETSRGMSGNTTPLPCSL